MSHFTTIKTKLIERDYLLQALATSGYRYEVGNVKIRGYADQQTTAEIRVKANDSFDIGFLRKEGSYECVADWWGIRNTTPERFLQQITQRYAYYATLDRLEQQGFTLTEERQEDDRIHLRLRRLT